eukprot:1181126-Prorocentrum_minimum.AAC.2
MKQPVRHWHLSTSHVLLSSTPENQVISIYHRARLLNVKKGCWEEMLRGGEVCSNCFDVHLSHRTPLYLNAV